MKLVRKMAVLVGVFAVAAATIAVVGVRRLATVNAGMQEIADELAKASRLSERTQQAILSAVRAQKNAVIVPDDEASKRYADESLEWSNKADKLRQELAAHASIRGNPEFRAATDAFERQWTEYRQLEPRLLDLCLQNTNVKSTALCFGALEEKVAATVRVLKTVADDLDRRLREKKDASLADWQSVARQIRQLDLASDEVEKAQHAVARHCATSDDAEKTKIDAEFAKAKDQATARLRSLATELQGEDRHGVEQAQALWLEAVRLADQAIVLSRANSNRRSEDVSMGEGRKTIGGSTEALTRLSDLLEQEVDRRAAANLEAGRSAIWIIAATAVVGIVAGLAIAGMIVHSITRPVARMVEVAQAIANKDLSERLGFRGADEIGELGAAVDKVAENFATIVADLQAKSRKLDQSSEELRLVSQGLLSQSEEASTQAANVAGATEELSTTVNSMAAAAEEMSMNVATISSASEEMSVNVGTISSAAQQTSQNVNAVARAVEEIGGSFGEVAREAREGSGIAAKAAGLAEAARTTMTELSQAAAEINKVTEAIKMIAMQTNLLALNATIEATSAGEAGKGFAVVANEIKELAHQSGKAAEGIAGRIEGVQERARQAVASMQSVADVIGLIYASATRITDSVDRQTASAHTISSNVNEASRGVGAIARSISEVASGANDVARSISEAAKAATAVSRNAAEAAKASTMIAGNIHGVSQAARETSASAQTLTRAADELTDVGGHLASTVGQFRTRA